MNVLSCLVSSVVKLLALGGLDAVNITANHGSAFIREDPQNAHELTQTA